MARSSPCLQLLSIGFTFLVLVLSADACIKMKDLHKNPENPSSEIKIVNFPGESILPIGSRVTILCSSNYSKKAVFDDQKNSQPYVIELSHNRRYLDDCGGDNTKDNEDIKTCFFVIQNATNKHSGIYSCAAHNVQQSCTTAEIKLEFENPSPPRFTINPPREIYVSSGSMTNLTCEAFGVPAPDIAWYRNGVLVPRKKTSGVKSVSLLILKVVTSAEQGKYWCEARNSFGRKRSLATSLFLTQKPFITGHPQTILEHLDRNFSLVLFHCKAIGIPRPAIDWLENNSTKANGTVIQTGSTSTLILVLHGGEKNLSKYSCVARNLAGQAFSCEATLKVFAYKESRDISFYAQPQNIIASLGDHVVLTCAAEGSAVPEIAWLKDEKKIANGNAVLFQGKGSSTSALTIQSVEKKDSGRYACQATSHGTSVVSWEAVLAIEDASARKESNENASKLSSLSTIMWISLAIGAFLLGSLGMMVCCMIHNRGRKNYGVYISREMQKTGVENNACLTTVL